LYKRTQLLINIRGHLATALVRIKRRYHRKLRYKNFTVPTQPTNQFMICTAPKYV